MDEFALIAEVFAPLARGAPGALGLTDDAAVFDVSAGKRLVVSKDMIVAGVHFLSDDPPETIARKLLRVNLSDLAAMGAEPRAYLLAIAAPRDLAVDWLRSFADGLAVDQAAFGVNLLGGDTVATDGPFSASLTALGEVRPGDELRRAGAQPGDFVYVSGSVGDAALGLRALRGELKGVEAGERDLLVERFRLPQPRVALGLQLGGIGHAAIDVSDGLVADLGHLCECSGVGVEFEAARVPLSQAARTALVADPELLTLVLTGGDDYEIAFSAADDGAVARLSTSLDLPLTAIGRVVEGTGVTVIGEQGRRLELPAGGYRHFDDP